MDLHRWFVVSLSSMALLLASCQPIVDTRGRNDEALDLSQIVAGQTTAEDVRALLGTPTSTGNFGEETWYYITQKQERLGLFAPEVTDQQVTAIAFDADKRVREVTQFRKEDGKPVQMVGKTTPTEGHSLSAVEQLLGNMGRFNAPSRGVSQRNMGR